MLRVSMSIGPKMNNAKIYGFWYSETQDCHHVARYYAHKAAKYLELVFDGHGANRGSLVRLVDSGRKMNMYFYWADDSNP